MAGRGNITKLGEKRYRVRVTIRTDKETKKREIVDKVIHGPKREAEAFLTETLEQRRTGRLVDPKKLTLGAYLDKWLAEGAKGKVRERTLRDYTDITQKRIKPRIGNVPLEILNPLTVQTFYNELAADGLASKTIRNTHAMLHRALRQAVRWRLLSYNPAADVEKPRLVKKEMGVLDSGQAEPFIEAAKQHPRGIVYLVALATGLRPQEYLAIQWPDVNLDRGTLRIQRTIYWPQGGGWRFEEMKTSGSRRTVTIPKPLRDLLRAYKAKQAGERLLAGELYENHGLMFANEYGRPLEKCNLNTRVFKKILAAAGLPLTLRPYDLRHYAEWAVMPSRSARAGNFRAWTRILSSTTRHNQRLLRKAIRSSLGR